ncbi:MAG: hypothetical protein NTV31_10545 [Bacteroidia bacterium]|nr:hypothetical protein [Bacteroidia bacterium]
MKTKATRNVLIFIFTFLALGAMIISPTGELLRMPLSNLGSSPFSNFLVPGIILFLIIGLLPLILVFALLNKPESKLAKQFNFFKDIHWSWTYSIYVAFALIIWMQIEWYFFLQYIGYIPFIYFLQS